MANFVRANEFGEVENGLYEMELASSRNTTFEFFPLVTV